MDKNIKIVNQLKEISNNYHENELTRYVASNILEYASGYTAQDEDTNDVHVKQYLEDLFQCGCSGGTVSELIYYKDTHAFFDKYYEEIMELVNEIEENQGQPIQRNGQDLKNFYAWLAYEGTAFNLASRLDIEI